MIVTHNIPPCIFFSQSTRGLNEGNMAKLSRLVKRARQARRSTSRRGVNMTTNLSRTYAMAAPSISRLIETARAATRELFGWRQPAGLVITRQRRGACPSFIKTF